MTAQVANCGRSAASPYGNFPNYYEFNPVDERIKHIPGLWPSCSLRCIPTVSLRVSDHRLTAHSWGMLANR